MASPLEGQIAKAIAQGFKGRLLKGTLRKMVAAESTDLDANGDPVDVGPEDFACEGFTDNYSAYTRLAAGIPDTDLKVCILAGSISVEPEIGDHVRFRNAGVWGPWHRVRQRATDPATALWELQSYVVQGDGT